MSDTNVCDYCGEHAINLMPEDMGDIGAGPINTYPAGDFHADCLIGDDGGRQRRGVFVTACPKDLCDGSGTRAPHPATLGADAGVDDQCPCRDVATPRHEDGAARVIDHVSPNCVRYGTCDGRCPTRTILTKWAS